MLTTLSIKNLALVDALTWELGSGLVGVTGETGAGKSIIVGALKLVLGGRADRDLIRNGEDACTVEAVFQPEQILGINEALEAAGLEPCEDGQLIIKRVIAHTGQNRQFINCAPATLAVLKTLGQFLVDLHGPHEHQSLNSRDRQLTMLDAAATAETALLAYQKSWRSWRDLTHAFDELNHAENVSSQELDLLRFQLEEIDSAHLKADEEEPLLQLYKMAGNSTRLAELSAGALGALQDADDSILTKLGDLRRSLRELERIDRGVASLTSGFESAFVELEELESSLRDYHEGLEFDPRGIEALEERINLLENLKRKYGGSVERVLNHRDQAAARLGRIEGRGDELERLRKESANARDAVNAAGVALGQLRRKAAPRLAKEVARHLGDLGFKQSKFTVELSPLTQPASSGLEEVDFMFAPNPGEPAKPLRVIASSGEMSRVMLAVKSALAREDNIPLLVFDEIDANVGGEIAAAVGRKMAELGRSHQIISITHLPQVAALATCHYVVSKVVHKDRTHSQLQRVEDEERVEEIARMLGGKADSARAHARSLLAGIA